MWSHSANRLYIRMTSQTSKLSRLWESYNPWFKKFIEQSDVSFRTVVFRVNGLQGQGGQRFSGVQGSDPHFLLPQVILFNIIYHTQAETKPSHDQTVLIMMEMLCVCVYVYCNLQHCNGIGLRRQRCTIKYVNIFLNHHPVWTRKIRWKKS